jgi:UDP-MurNAc hydroxylase
LRITHLGHASLYIETADVRILVDPALEDLHQEGLFEIFPARKVNWEKLPEFEILFISHHHQDHFDIATLAKLPRDVQVIIPANGLINEVFLSLGYKFVQSLEDFSTFEVGATRFMLTPSIAPVVEHGLVISNSSGTFWNQVDTILTPGQTDVVLAQNPPIDLLFAPWQPMLEQNWQNNQSLAFPFAEYNVFLQNIGQVKPKAVVPGANGFCYAGAGEWLNHVVFPQTRARFLRDIETMLPHLQGNTFEADAGDVIEINDGEIHFKHQASEFVVSDEYDPTVLEFRPATVGRALHTSYDSKISFDESVAEFVREVLPKYIRENSTLFRAHQDWEIIFQLEIAFADKSEYWWYDFRESNVTAHPGRTSLANFRSGIAVAELCDLLHGNCSWDKVSLGGNFYQQQSIYGIWKNGLILPQGVSITNPLFALLPYEETFAKMIEKQLKSLS